VSQIESSLILHLLTTTVAVPPNSDTVEPSAEAGPASDLIEGADSAQ
jgi:hypothetical protein